MEIYEAVVGGLNLPAMNGRQKNLPKPVNGAG